MSEITFTIEGIAPLIMHNGQLANPLNATAKAIKVLTAQRKKSDETHLELSRLEFFGGLYLSRDGVVEVPSEVIESTLIEGAKKSKLGKAFKSAIMVADNAPLNYGKKFTPEEMWAQPDEFVDVRPVKVNQSRIMRTRPIFRRWSLDFTVTFNADLINPEQVQLAVEDAGIQVGLCDYRPKFGRFHVTAVS